ncbi:class I SAM-dependent methyltransferase [Massilia sp. BKSP1R2A-1]|jgi:SAM-dependent methyltransferase|uniref:class I SAM-dependent methyltransferase n=1 Tax=Massilia sp. BKSP1R2A-1 TaxID=3422595 RepID=UPI003D336D97
MSQPVPSTPAPRQPDAVGPDYAAIKQRQQATWASGDFAVVGVTLQIVGESLAEAADIRAGERVIDIAAGNGNASLAAAHRFARVTSTDYVPALLEKGRARAAAEGLQIDFREADAEALPFGDASFDVALSTFGVMFAPDQQRCAREMMRVVRPGGRIGLANWTAEGMIGQLFNILGRYVAPPAGLSPPSQWGNEDYLRQLFGAEAASVRCTRRIFNFRYASPAHWIQVFRDYYGPLHKAFGALDADRQQALEADIAAMLQRFNVAGDDALVAPAEYLEAVIVKRLPEVLH